MFFDSLLQMVSIIDLIDMMTNKSDPSITYPTNLQIPQTYTLKSHHDQPNIQPLVWVNNKITSHHVSCIIIL